MQLRELVTALEGSIQQKLILVAIQGPQCRINKALTVKAEIKTFQKEILSIVASLSCKTIYPALFSKKSNNLSLHNTFHSRKEGS